MAYNSMRQTLCIFSVLLVCVQTLVSGYSTVDPNGCTIALRNVTEANSMNAVQNKDLKTVEACLEYCIGLVQRPACVAVEFDKSNSSNFGCWVHRNMADLRELFDAGPNVVQYQLMRDCGALSQNGTMNDTMGSNQGGMQTNMSHTDSPTMGNSNMSGDAMKTGMMTSAMMTSAMMTSAMTNHTQMPLAGMTTAMGKGNGTNSTEKAGQAGQGSVMTTVTMAMQTTPTMSSIMTTMKVAMTTKSNGNGAASTRYYDDDAEGSADMKTTMRMKQMTTGKPVPNVGSGQMTTGKPVPNVGSGQGESTDDEDSEGSGAMVTTPKVMMTTTKVMMTTTKVVMTTAKATTANDTGPAGRGSLGTELPGIWSIMAAIAASLVIPMIGAEDLYH